MATASPRPETEHGASPIVMTGAGVVTVYGDGVDALWSGLKSNVTGVHELMGIPPARGKKRGAQISTSSRNHPFRVRDMAVDAAVEALEMAGLELPEANVTCGLYLGTTGGSHRVAEDRYLEFEGAQMDLHAGSRPELSAELRAGLRGYPFSAFASDIAARIQHRGPRMVVSNACASGNIAIALALAALRRGVIDRAVVIGADELRASTYWGAERSGFIGHDLRPFHKDRDGSVMGDGAGAVVLERAKDAAERQVEPLAQISGWGIACDRSPHEIIPPEDGLASAIAIKEALEDGEIAFNEIDYFNAHGTGTPRIDSLETLSIKQVMGEDAKNLAMNSTKSMVGHLSAASPIIEIVATWLQMQHQWVHATAKLDDIDPKLDLDYVPLEGRDHKIGAAVSNSLGGGGTNCAIALRDLHHGPTIPTRNIQHELELVITGAAAIDNADGNFSVLDYCMREDGYHHVSDAAQLGYAAGLTALDDAKVAYPFGDEVAQTATPPNRIAVVVGTHLGGLPVLSENMARQLSRDPRRITPNMALDHGPQLTATLLCRKTDIRGPIITLPSGSTSGIQGIAVAVDLLSSGSVEQVIIVGVDHVDAATVDAASMLGQTGILAEGGGAGAVVVESRENAEKRGVVAHAKLSAVETWASNDDNGLADSSKALDECLERVNSGVNPEHVVVVDGNGQAEGSTDLIESAPCGLMAATPLIALANLVKNSEYNLETSFNWVLACTDHDGQAAAIRGVKVGAP